MLQESIIGEMKISYKAELVSEDSKMLFFNEKGQFLNFNNDKNDICFLREVKKELEGFDADNSIFAFEIEDTEYFIYKVTSKKDANMFKAVSKKEVLNTYPEKESYIILSGWHIFNWYENTKYCGHCGTLLDHKKNERAKVCPKCSTVYYPQIAPAVIVAIKDGDKLLLTKYANNPLAHYALVAGFIEIGETPEDAVRREVMEEVGIKIKNIKYFASQPWGITGGLLIGYSAELDGNSEITLDLNELSEGTWMTRKEAKAIGFTYKTLTGTLINTWINKE